MVERNHHSIISKAHSEKEKLKKDAKSLISESHDGVMETVKVQSRILKNKRETMQSVHVSNALSRMK